MPTIGDLVHDLLPAGTVPGGVPRIAAAYRTCPVWPPDAFAVAATISYPGAMPAWLQT